MYYSEQTLLTADGRNNFRIPSVIATKNGTILAFVNNRIDTLEDHSQETNLVLCRKKPGEDWEPMREIVAESGVSCKIGTAVYDEAAGTAICLFLKTVKPLHEFGKYTAEERAAAQEASLRAAREKGVEPGFYAAVSRDDGSTWQVRKVEVTPNALGFTGSTHGASAGITIRNGPHAGRLLCAARYVTGSYSDREGLKQYCYNAAIYSDDHGLTWHTSLPVQQGTGEGALAELEDGRIYYNSRAYFDDNLRYIAYSCDGGESFGGFATDTQLLEPVFGCSASLVRAEYNGQRVLLFSNPRHPGSRVNMTVSISCDDARTWKARKCINHGPSAYSCLTYSEKTKRVFLLYETGRDSTYEGINVVEFDLEWLMES